MGSEDSCCWGAAHPVTYRPGVDVTQTNGTLYIFCIPRLYCTLVYHTVTFGAPHLFVCTMVTFYSTSSFSLSIFLSLGVMFLPSDSWISFCTMCPPPPILPNPLLSRSLTRRLSQQIRSMTCGRRSASGTCARPYRRVCPAPCTPCGPPGSQRPGRRGACAAFSTGVAWGGRRWRS